MPHFGTPETLEEISMAITESINDDPDKKINIKLTSMIPTKYRIHTSQLAA